MICVWEAVHLELEIIRILYRVSQHVLVMMIDD